GNSGGPLFTTEGTVIGITTFGDFTSEGGPGISGIVRIDEARSAIEDAQKTLTQPPLPEGTLPVEPTMAFPVAALKAAVAAQPPRGSDYAMGAGDFDVQFITPILLYGTQVAVEQAALKEKEKRNNKPQSAANTVDIFSQFKNWAEYVGEYRPVLM